MLTEGKQRRNVMDLSVNNDRRPCKPPPCPNPPRQQDKDDKRHWLILYGIAIKKLIHIDSTGKDEVSAACYYADRGLAAANERFNK